MKSILTVVEADMAASRLGLRSRLMEEFGGSTVLEAAFRGAEAVEGTVGTVVTCAAADEEAVRKALGGRGRVLASEGKDSPSRAVLRRTRKWATGCWRGGIGGTSWFDEFGNPSWMEAARELSGADAVLLVGADAPFLDPALISGLAAHAAREIDTFVFVFSLAPAGLSGAVYSKGMLSHMVGEGLSACSVLRFNPQVPAPDPNYTAANFRIDERLRVGGLRLTADSRRGLETLRELRDGAARHDPLGLAEAFGSDPAIRAGKVPREVELEISGDWRLAPEWDARRAHGRRDLAMGMGLFEKIVGELAEYDDVLLTFGGCGEPTLHPDLARMIAVAREAGIWGIQLVTDGERLEGDLLDALIRHEADVLTVKLWAHDREDYGRVWGQDSYGRVVANIDSLAERLRQRGSAAPLVLPEILKIRELQPKIEAFVEHWESRSTWPVIRGFNDYAGQIPDRSILHLTLAKRRPCCRIEGRMYVLPDGRVPACDQDFLGRRIVGDLSGDSVRGVWTGKSMADLRDAHARGRYGEFDLCLKCRDWDHM